MTEDYFPITPPPELFAEWLSEAKRLHPNESFGFISGQIAQLAYRAGADQELEACCEWLKGTAHIGIDLELLHARRPKPPSLKELALAALDDAILRGDCITTSDALPAIRHALDQLDD